MPDYDWTDEERSAARLKGWTGCKLWAKRCQGGTRCKREGETPWTPVTLPTPKMRPAGVRPQERRICGCPERLPARIWSAVRRWQDARRGNGMPAPGHVCEQPAWLLGAFGVLDAEWSLIELAMREAQADKATEGR